MKKTIGNIGGIYQIQSGAIIPGDILKSIMVPGIQYTVIRVVFNDAGFFLYADMLALLNGKHEFPVKITNPLKAFYIVARQSLEFQNL